jgi:hypothetical protein
MKRRSFFNGFSNLYSCNFDGVNDYVTAGGVSDFKYYHGATNPSAFAFSIGVWVKLVSPTANAAQTIFNTNANSTANVGIIMLYDNRASVPATRRITLIISRGVSGAANTVVTVLANSVYPNTTGWVHVLCTYDQALASNNSNLYINNVLVNTSSKNGLTPSTANASFPMIFGINNNISTLPLNGRLYGMTFINKVLSLAERNELYNNPHKNAKGYSFAANVTNAYRFPQGQSGFPTWLDYAGGVSGTMTNQLLTDIVLDRP